ncbi:hypothetical protein [Pantoea allii]|uniref:hypothetical protein n=1 Tax=Pantoea allii TaxID=574096 RepID=UPI001F4E30F8|nr:hypothetical protein [Pantoea allii]MCH9299132.1 hypothetical protein [Pantoea allii]
MLSRPAVSTVSLLFHIMTSDKKCTLMAISNNVIGSGYFQDSEAGYVDIWGFSRLAGLKFYSARHRGNGAFSAALIAWLAALARLTALPFLRPLSPERPHRLI